MTPRRSKKGGCWYTLGGRRVRGGGYWGVASEEVRDLAAWVDLLEGLGSADGDELAQAKRMIAEGNPDDLVRIPKRSFPSFVSAATFMDDAQTPPELGDFFGLQTPNAGVTRVRCPLC